MEQDWRRLNHAHWDGVVDLHRGSEMYDLSELRRGEGRLDPIVAPLLSPVEGLKIAHLQCHVGRDSLILAQQGAHVTGLDFSGKAISAAREIAQQLDLAARARFVEADLYDAEQALGDAGTYDLVFVTWGAIGWLPDIKRWAHVAAAMLKPGGRLLLVEGHPAALVFDGEGRDGTDAFPGRFISYFHNQPIVSTGGQDYAVPDTVGEGTVVEYMHGLQNILGAVLDAGLRITAFGEYAATVWRMFPQLVAWGDGTFRWPETSWLPLSFSLNALKQE